MTDSRKERHKERAKLAVIDKARREGRLRESRTGRCGPWVDLGNGSERCMKCNCLEFIEPIWEDDD